MSRALPVPRAALPGRVCGVDEAGRGPLAGAVFAAAVILDPAQPIEGLADSKQLSGARREHLAGLIRARALAWAVASASVAEIDALNILQASLLAMRRAVEALSPPAELVLVDGLHVPHVTAACQALVGGDASVAEISAASILAKVSRDAEMRVADGEFPCYGFADHKGYATARHLAALAALGPCRIHRGSFAPVRAVLAQGKLAW